MKQLTINIPDKEDLKKVKEGYDESLDKQTVEIMEAIQKDFKINENYKVEYDFYYYDWNQPHSKIKEDLNERGKDGWMIIAQSDSSHYFVLRRFLKEPEKNKKINPTKLMEKLEKELKTLLNKD